MNETNVRAFDWHFTPDDEVHPLELVGKVILTSQINRPPTNPDGEPE